MKMENHNTMLVLLKIFLAIVSVNGAYTFDGIVSTNKGKLEGYTMTSRDGRQFWAFSGIPYAQPPIGKLRFFPPVPAEPWTGIREAKEDGPFCIQWFTPFLNPETMGVEDCLYLTLYTHDVRRRAPVLVHFHGGAFSGGNGPRITKPYYLMDQDIVLVDVNYRLRMFGFLSFNDAVMPGNAGLKDQVMALKWVQDNIANFGGDPNSVTIMGESTGGMNVYQHIVSPLTKGLFHRAICESGASYNQDALRPASFGKALAKKLVRLVGCRGKNTAALVNCLQSLNATYLVEQAKYFRVWQFDPFLDFSPVLEPNIPGAFLVGPVSAWRPKNVPLLMGTTSAEGLMRSGNIFDTPTDFEFYSKNFNALAPFTLRYFALPSMVSETEVTKQVRNYYLKNTPITPNDRNNITQMYTEVLYQDGIIETAVRHARSSTVYFYYFAYIGEYSQSGLNRTYITGPSHQEEMLYLWYYEQYSPLKGQDVEISKVLVEFWSNFVKFGDPTPGNVNVKWLPWDPDCRYLSIDNKVIKMKNKFIKDSYKLWQIVPKPSNL